MSRQQQSSSLSSCEAQLISLTPPSQDTLGITRLLQFAVSDLIPSNITREEFLQSNVEELPRVLLFSLETDSSSALAALAVVNGDGLTRKVRHMNIPVVFFAEAFSNRRD